jgi:hypothetical protein
MTPPFVLRDLRCSARVTIAVFLIAVLLGYFSALVQLHVQHARPGDLLPSKADVVRIYHGTAGAPKSTLQRLLEADESLPFNGSGTMAPAFTKRSDGWTDAIRDRAKEKNISRAEAEKELRKQRDGERHAVLAWLAQGAVQAAYNDDAFALPDEISNDAFTPEYLDGSTVKLRTLITDRCVRCHSIDGEDDNAAKFPLGTYEKLQPYMKPELGGSRMSLAKLAQSTHAHLLSFAMLFGLTGVLFAHTSYPKPLRMILAPGVLIVQVLDIALWWLARIDGQPGEAFAQMIPITGAIVGAGLLLQVGLTLLHLFGLAGRMALLALLLAALAIGNTVRVKFVEPYLKARVEQPKN